MILTNYGNDFLQVVDYAECGNIHESMPQQSVFSLIQMLTQLASAMEYLERENLIHLRVSAASMFVVKPGKVRTNSVIWWIDYEFLGL